MAFCPNFNYEKIQFHTSSTLIFIILKRIVASISRHGNLQTNKKSVLSRGLLGDHTKKKLLLILENIKKGRRWCLASVGRGL